MKGQRWKVGGRQMQNAARNADTHTPHPEGSRVGMQNCPASGSDSVIPNPRTRSSNDRWENWKSRRLMYFFPFAGASGCSAHFVAVRWTFSARLVPLGESPQLPAAIALSLPKKCLFSFQYLFSESAFSLPPPFHRSLLHFPCGKCVAENVKQQLLADNRSKFGWLGSFSGGLVFWVRFCLCFPFGWCTFVRFSPSIWLLVSEMKRDGWWWPASWTHYLVN